jgi:hypothetical protein
MLASGCAGYEMRVRAIYLEYYDQVPWSPSEIQ